MERVPVVTRLRRPPSRDEFALVVEQHIDAVHAYLRYLTGDRDLAEDLTAETFERAYTGWRRFDPDRGGVRTWLCQLARSRALDHFRSEERRRRRESVYALREPEAASDVFGDGLSPELEAALARLSGGERCGRVTSPASCGRTRPRPRRSCAAACSRSRRIGASPHGRSGRAAGSP